MHSNIPRQSQEMGSREEDGQASSSTDISGTVVEEIEDINAAQISMSYLFVLTCPSLGVQVLWLITMAYGTPYMTGLGMPTSVTALIWLSGPLSGTVAQPLFAAMSDRSRHPWGKRRPLIAGGAICVALSVLGLASAEDVVGLCTGAASDGRMAYGSMMGGPAKSSLVTKLLVVFWAFTLNVAMQPLQCGLRALLVDVCPARQQSTAAAWSTCFSGLGAVLISGLAFLDLSRAAPFLGGTPFKTLSVAAVFALAATVTPVCLVAHERPTKLSRRRNMTAKSLTAAVWRTVQDLPPVTRQVCCIQFSAWLGWFVVLYYSTTYVYQTFVTEEHVHLDPTIFGGADPRLVQMGKQAGMRASFVFASAMFVTATLLLLVARNTMRIPSSEARSLVPVVTICGLSLARVWQLGHMLFAAMMFLTCFVWTVPAATAILGGVAVSWAVTQWAPYALISAEVAALQTHALSGEKSDVADEDWQGTTACIMGVHNMAISMPQVLAALVCSVLFKMVEMAGRDDSAAFAFKFAGLMAAMAAWQGRNLV